MTSIWRFFDAPGRSPPGPSRPPLPPPAKRGPRPWQRSRDRYPLPADRRTRGAPPARGGARCPPQAAAGRSSTSFAGSTPRSEASAHQRWRRRCARTASAQTGWKMPTRYADGSARCRASLASPPAASHLTQASCAASSTHSAGSRSAAACATCASTRASTDAMIASRVMRTAAGTQPPTPAERRVGSASAPGHLRAPRTARAHWLRARRRPTRHALRGTVRGTSRSSHTTSGVGRAGLAADTSRRPRTAFAGCRASTSRPRADSVATTCHAEPCAGDGVRAGRSGNPSAQYSALADLSRILRLFRPLSTAGMAPCHAHGAARFDGSPHARRRRAADGDGGRTGGKWNAARAATPCAHRPPWARRALPYPFGRPISTRARPSIGSASSTTSRPRSPPSCARCRIHGL